MLSFKNFSEKTSELFTSGYTYGFSTASVEKKFGTASFKSEVSATHSRKFPENLYSTLVGSVQRYGCTLTSQFTSVNKEVAAELRLPSFRGLTSLVKSTVCLEDRLNNETKLGAAYSSKHVSADAELTVNRDGITTEGSMMAGKLGFFLGAQGSVGTQNKCRHTFTAGYRAGDLQVAAGVDNGDRFTASLNATRGSLEGAIQASISRRANMFGAALRWNVNPCMTVAAKITSFGEVAANATYKVADGIQLCASGKVDVRNLKSTRHHAVGLGVQFEF